VLIELGNTDSSLKQGSWGWEKIQNEYENQDNISDVLKVENSNYIEYPPPFRILGNQVEDVDAQSHVLSPPLMEALQNFLPLAVSNSNFLMKYSLIRDGASLYSMMQHIRGVQRTIIAIETQDGNVFGSFTSEPWRLQSDFFGNGEAFLWRMRQSRNTPCDSIIDQAKLEGELDVFPWTGKNYFIQLYNHDKLAVGGGVDSDMNDMSSGFGLTIDKDLLSGESNPCESFANPSLCQNSSNSFFDIVNIEVWTLTFAETEEEAEKVELANLFLENKRVNSDPLQFKSSYHTQKQ